MSGPAGPGPAGPPPAGPPGDCECHHGRRVQQPVNALSSLAYVVAGAAVHRDVATGRSDPAMDVLAGLLVAEGVGSVAFHTGPGRVAHLAHDVPLLGLLGHLAGWSLGRVAGDAPGGARWGAGLAGVGGGLARLASPRVMDGAAGAAAALGLGAALAARRKGLAPGLEGGVAPLAAASLACWWAGFTARPWCRPTSPWQPHALWHVGSAATLVAWSRRTRA